MIFKNLFRRNRETAKTIVIFGIGNHGTEYRETRHNAGFLALDFLQQDFGLENFQEEKKLQAEITSGKVSGVKFFLVKPTTFMNESGKSVQTFLDFYKLEPASLVVIHDEVDLPLGTIRTTSSSRSAGHKGVESVILALGTQEFFRIRLGIGKPIQDENACIPLHDYVLQKFSPKEKDKVESLFPEVKKIVKDRL